MLAVLEKTAVKGQYDNTVEPGMITTTIISPTVKGALRWLSYPHILLAYINLQVEKITPVKK